MAGCPVCGSENTGRTACRTVNDRTIAAGVCSDCGHTRKQPLCHRQGKSRAVVLSLPVSPGIPVNRELDERRCHIDHRAAVKTGNGKDNAGQGD